MVFLGGEMVSYERDTPAVDLSTGGPSVQGYLTYKKKHPPRTLP